MVAAIAPSNKNPLEYMENNANIIFQSSPVTEKEVENILLHFISMGWIKLGINYLFKRLSAVWTCVYLSQYFWKYHVTS